MQLVVSFDRIEKLTQTSVDIFSYLLNQYSLFLGKQ